MVLRARLGSVPPNVGSGFHRASSVAPRGLPSYAAAHGNYYLGTGGTATKSHVTPLRASSVAPLSSTASIGARTLAPSSVSVRARSLIPSTVTSSTKITRSKLYDPIYPSRQFGSKLGMGYATVSQKPTIYDEYYGTSYVPSGGRDSWSAYRLSDATLDDNDELAYLSKRKDYEVMKDVNRKIARAASVPPLARAPVRAGSVPPATGKFVARPAPLSVRSTGSVSSAQVSRLVKRNDKTAGLRNVSQKPPIPAVQVRYSTVEKGSELLHPKYRVWSREEVDLESPAAVMNMKLKLANVQNLMDRQRELLSKHSGGDAEINAINSEIRAMKSAQARRAQSVI